MILLQNTTAVEAGGLATYANQRIRGTCPDHQDSKVLNYKPRQFCRTISRLAAIKIIA